MPEGIPQLPDLTHPQELIQWGGQVSQVFVLLILVIGFFGLVLAALTWANRSETSGFIDEWVLKYSQILRILQHGSLILAIVIGGFFLCSTLANRYHNWEQAQIASIAETVAGDRLEQAAPLVRYEIEKSYPDIKIVDGKPITVEVTRQEDRFLNLNGSQIQVKIEQQTNPQDLRAIYQVDYKADYTLTNPLKSTSQLFFEAAPPSGYILLQGFKVTRDGEALAQINPGDYGFPFRLDPGQMTTFQVSYLARGGPRWVYDASNQLLTNFKLVAQAQFPQADFASGITPTETVDNGSTRQFTWIFSDNVSVRNPFGVFTATNPVRNTGILPRLLVLAPAVFLWWLALLYLSLPISLKDVSLASGVFFAGLLSLTYLSRLGNPVLAWAGISLLLLGVAWKLGRNKRGSLASVISTIAGLVIPVLALLVPYSGLTLSLAGLLSVGWLAVRHWQDPGTNASVLS